MRLAAIGTVIALALLTPALARASTSCHEVSDIVGEERCTRFGNTWSLERTPPIFFRFGMRYSENTTDDLSFGAGKTKGASESIPYEWRGRSLGFNRLDNIGVEGGLGFFVWGQLYTGVDSHISLGHVGTRATSVLAGGQTLRLTQDSGVNVVAIGGAVPIGYRIPLGRAAIRTEVAFGFERYDISHQVALPTGQSWEGTASAMRAVIEPRIAGEIWFTQHMAFGVAAGMNLIGGNYDRSLGITLAWHGRAFDGGTAW